jgi:hypothetical protein
MPIRTVIAVLAACVTLSTSIGFAAAKLSEPDHAKAGGDKAVVRELAKLNTAIGTPTFLGQSDAIDLLAQICDNTGGPASAC